MGRARCGGGRREEGGGGAPPPPPPCHGLHREEGCAGTEEGGARSEEGGGTSAAGHTNASPTTQLTLAPPAAARAASSPAFTPPASAAAMNSSICRGIGTGTAPFAAGGPAPSGTSTKRRFHGSSAPAARRSCAMEPAVERNESVAPAGAPHSRLFQEDADGLDPPRPWRIAASSGGAESAGPAHALGGGATGAVSGRGRQREQGGVGAAEGARRGRARRRAQGRKRRRAHGREDDKT